MSGETRNVIWLLGIISFVNETCSELIYPLLPLYLTTAAAIEPRLLGLVEGLALSATSVIKLLAGVLADRSRHTRQWVAGGYALAAIARPLYVLAHSWAWLFLLRLSERVGRGLRAAPRDALLATSAPAEQLGRSFGIHRAFDHAGAVAGPLLAALLLKLDVSLRDIFLWSALPGALVVLATLCVREPQPAVRHGAPFSWRLAAFPRPFRRLLAVQILFMLGYPSNLFILIRSGELGIPHFELPLLWGLVALTSASFSPWLSAWSDRSPGRIRIIQGGWVIHALFFWIMGVNHEWPWLLWILFPCFGLYLAASEGPLRALVADSVEHRQLGSAYGWFNLTTGLMLLPASWLFGELWEAAGGETAFTFSALCSLSAALLLRGCAPLPSGKK